MGNFFYYFCRELFLLPLRPFTRYHYVEMDPDSIPKTGPVLLLSNHISHFDPPFMARGFPRVIHFMADKPLLEIPIFGPLMRWGHVFPIDRTKNDRAALKTTLQRIAAGHVVAIFAERGIRHGKISVLCGDGELPLGTAALWKSLDVPVVPMVIIGTDQVYAWKKLWKRPRIFIRVGKTLPPDKNATREELRDRLTASWKEIFATMQRDYNFDPEELPQSAHKRWGVAEPPHKLSHFQTKDDEGKTF